MRITPGSDEWPCPNTGVKKSNAPSPSTAASTTGTITSIVFSANDLFRIIFLPVTFPYSDYVVPDGKVARTGRGSGSVLCNAKRNEYTIIRAARQKKDKW